MAGQTIKQFTEVSFQKTIDFNKNNVQTEDLRLGSVYRELYLKLKYTLKTDSSNAYATSDLSANGAWGIIKYVELLVNGNTIRNIPGNVLSVFNNIIYGSMGSKPSALDSSIAVSTSAAVETELILPLWSPDTNNSMDTALDAKLLSSMQMRIHWGDVADVASTTGLSFDVNPTVDVYSYTSTGLSGPFNTYRLYELVDKNVSSGDNFRRPLTVGNLYRGILVNTKQKGSTKDTTSLALDNLKVVSGNITFQNVDAELANTLWRQRRALYQDNSIFQSSNASVKGWYYLDFVQDGYLREAIDTYGLSEFNLILDVNSNVDIYTYPFEMMAIRNKQG